MKSVVLLSAGMDSTVNAWAASKESELVLALTFDYGQKAASKELMAAKRVAAKLNVPHKVVELPFFRNFGGSSLLDANKSVPSGAAVSIDDLAVSKTTASSVWVPNRNGIFLNVAAGFAEALGAKWIVPGFNKEEAQTFPDNSQAYLEAATESLSFSTANKVEVHCFTTAKTKSEIVAFGEKLGVDWSLMWPCYLSGVSWCGQCESCQRSKRALAAAGLSFDEFAKRTMT